MSNLTSVHVTDGIPDTGTGDVSTLDAVLAVLPAALAAHGGLKIEGVASGVAVPISGTVSATNPSVGANADPIPASSTLIAFSDSGAQQPITPAFPLPIYNAGDPIAVTGTVTANLGTIGAAAIAAKQPALGTAGTASADVITIQGIASGIVVPVSDGGGSLTVDGAISFTAPQHVIVDSGTVTTVSTVTTITNVVHVDDNSGSLTVDGTLKTGYGTATAFTKTNANLAASVTAGWKSNAIDNTSTKALDALVGIELAAVNTAPAGTKTLYLYAYGLIEGTAYTSTGDGTIDGTEGTVTFPSVTTLPVVLRLIGTVPYPVQNKAINGGPFSVAAAFGGILPDKWGVAMVNDTGMTLSVTNIFYQEITNTVG